MEGIRSPFEMDVFLLELWNSIFLTVVCHSIYSSESQWYLFLRVTGVFDWLCWSAYVSFSRLSLTHAKCRAAVNCC
jgi:hypothetical protein